MRGQNGRDPKQGLMETRARNERTSPQPLSLDEPFWKAKVKTVARNENVNANVTQWAKDYMQPQKERQYPKKMSGKLRT